MFGRLLLLLRRWLCSTRRRKPEHPCDTPCRTARRIESWAIPSLLRAPPSATSEHLLGLLGSSPIPPSSSLLAFAFHWGHFPPPALPGFVGTTGLPSPHTARSGPRGLPVDRELRSPLRLPVFRLVSFACMLSPIPRQRPMEPVSLMLSTGIGLPRLSGGSAPASAVSGPARCLHYITACMTRRVALKRHSTSEAPAASLP